MEIDLNKKIKLYGIKFHYSGGAKDKELYGKFENKEDAIKFEKEERRALQWHSSLKTTISYKTYTLRQLFSECLKDNGIKSIKLD